MLTMMNEELRDIPLFYVLDGICSVADVSSTKMTKFRSALLHAGFRVSGSHCHSGAIKTDAPSDVIWDIVRCLAKEEGKLGRSVAGSKAEAILRKEPLLSANFAIHPDAEAASKQKGLLRFQRNPLPNWGPKLKARQRQSDVSENSGERRNESSEEYMARIRHERQGTKRKLKKLRNPKDLKRFTCKRFTRGECTLGDRCCYSHDGPAVSSARMSAGAHQVSLIDGGPAEEAGRKDYDADMFTEDVNHLTIYSRVRQTNK
ncbi:PREDICTED: tRNA (guanine(26)-N(2))-dimethyltransferase-like [Priapulus caudatus]|uniref:tRNA (guanine(26)-N(2))-dimethyltransferase n=1 Tax=Priapulus caudatus TaxID=37621 RepID=A0ABM1EF27_PRICU|nr:PREDICTED: tRNA (guanine(26)-N(2))-dimethyltransferase-like [Priapulus caudatus]